MQTLKQAIYLASSGNSPQLARAASYLIGKPEGSWAETAQARERILGELPIRSARDYTVADFIEAAYRIEPRYNSAGIYRSALEDLSCAP